MANTKRTTTNRTGGSGAKTPKAASQAAPAAKTVKTAPEETEYDDADEFDEYEAAVALEAKAEAAAQEAEAAAEEAESAAEEAEAAAEEAEAAAHAATAARAALAQRSSPASSKNNPNPKRRARRREKQNGSTGLGDNDGYLNMMSGLLGNMTSGDWDDDAFDDMSQGVAMVLGSGPAFATLGTMLANSTAQSSVLMNATQMQRQLDIVGLQCTSACVQQLLNMNNGTDDPD